MWVFTTTGFFSAVAHRDHPSVMLVRARRKSHLKLHFPHAEIIELDNSDYPWRIQITKQEFAAWLADEVSRIDYPNFKAAISRSVDGHHKYTSACHDVWRTMQSIE